MDIKNNFTTKKDKLDAIDAIAKFKLGILGRKPSMKIMMHEIQMSKLKIRPHAGDIFGINVADSGFVEALWSMIKLDDYVNQVSSNIKKTDERIFTTLVNSLRNELNTRINEIDIRLPHLKKFLPQPVAIEIFRDRKAVGKRGMA